MLLAINLKAYEEAIGQRALEIAKAAERICDEENIEIVIAPQHTDIYLLSSNVDRVKIFAQHIDPIDPGAHTGWILPLSVKEAGATGTLLNHSEHQMKVEDIERAIKIAKDLGLETIVCANDPTVARALASLEPTYIAVEPPELIGTGVSVSKAKPEIITNTIEMVRECNSKVKILVGAGISTKEDVSSAIRLGADGVLLASAVAKSKDPYRKIKELVEGFKV